MEGLTKDRVIERIQAIKTDFDGKGLSKLQLLSTARHYGAMTLEQIKASTPLMYRVYKCYLWTVLEDPTYREKVERYVIANSLLWTRAHYIMNLWFHGVTGIPFARRQELDLDNLIWKPREEEEGEAKEDDEPPSPSFIVYHKLFTSYRKNNLLLRHALLPELYQTSKRTSLDDQIEATIAEHGADLKYLFPTDWQDIMSRTGWDGAISSAASCMRTSIDLHLRRSVVRCAKKYVKLLQEDIDTKVLYELLNKPWPSHPPSEVKEEVLDHIKQLRHVIGYENSCYLPTEAFQVTYSLVDLFVHFCNIGMIKRSYLPLSSLTRKYTYIDSKVGRELFNLTDIAEESHDHNVLHSLNLSLQAFRQIQSSKRKRLRKETRGKKKLHQKWKKKGKVSIPYNGVVKSVMTDGVGLSIRYCVPMKIPKFQNFEPKTKKRKKFDKTLQQEKIIKMRAEDNGISPTFVGIDGGRAKLFCASTQKKGEPKPSVFTYSRKQYYWDIGHSKRQKEELERVVNDIDLRTAREALAVAGMEYNLLSYLQVQSEHSAVLIGEAVESKFYSFRRMRSFRLRKSALSRACNALIEFGQERGRRLVLGIGDAGFASTGRGEKAVPVKSITKSLDEVIKTRNMHQKNNQQGSISSLTINEFRTTLICSSCCSITTQPWVQKPNGNIYKSSRLRRCKNCDPFNGKLRDRDIQASRNILRLTGLEYYGFPRPPELSRQNKSSKSRV